MNDWLFCLVLGMALTLIGIASSILRVAKALEKISGQDLTNIHSALESLKSSTRRILPLIVLALISPAVRTQTLTLQSGVGASSNLGTRTGPIVEGRLLHPWIYARGRIGWQKKDYLNSGTIGTGDLMVRFTHRELWAGAGVEVSRASTVAYEKTALRLLLGGGYSRPEWAIGVFGFAPEANTRNRTAGLRAELDLIPWRAEKLAFVITARPYWLRYHNGPEWGRARSGGGVDLLAGVRFGR